MKKVVTFFSLILLIIITSCIDISSVSSIENSLSMIKDNSIPRLYFEGDVDKLKTKKEEIKITTKYESSDINFKGFAKIKLQGTSSLQFEKKNYTIKFYKDENLDEKLNINLGWGDENKYCLKANWVDKTHARNVVSTKIISKVQKKYNLFEDAPNYGVIDGFPIEVFLNNEFLGLYTLNIPKDAWMFNMDEENPNHLVFSGEGWTNSNYFKEEANFDDWEAEVGEESEENLEKLNRLFSFVINSTDEEFKNNIENYFNLDSLLNYYVMLEVAELADNVAKNMLLVTYDGKIWYTSLYDLDASWGTSWNGSEIFDYNNEITPGGSRLWERLKTNFPNELADRYFELRKSILKEKSIFTEFNYFIDSIPLSVYEKESNRWEDIPGYDIKQITDYLNKRFVILDKRFSNMYVDEAVVTIVYDKNDDGSVTAKLISNRQDFVVEDSEIYTFENNGEYKFYYNDFSGNIKFVIAKVTGIEYNL